MTNPSTRAINSVKIGDRVCIKPGFGYWDITNYPIGGNFKRVASDSGAMQVEVTRVYLEPIKGCNLQAKMLNGRLVAFSFSHTIEGAITL